MKVIDIFSGVGGLSLGFHLAGFKTELAIEYNEGIAGGYKANFPSADLINDDINKIDLNKLFTPFDGNKYILIGGPPCQGFSQKGQRRGLKDERNFMFLKYMEVVECLRPKVLLIENVPGLLTSENGYFISDIEEKLATYGYNTHHRVLDAVDYGVPQTRKRAFIVGVKENSKSFEWPVPVVKPVTVEEALSDLPKLKSGEGSHEMEYFSEPNSPYQTVMRSNSSKVKNHIATKHSELVLERLSLIPENGGRHDLPQEHLTKSTYSGTWCRLSRNRPARTITTRFDTPSSGMFTLPDQDRCLTVREAARLQSFPDHFNFVGSKSIQMLQVGNAVPPLLAKAIAQSIKSILV